jgi:hypothetical protein
MSSKHYDWRLVYLAALRQLPVIKHACEVAQVDRATAWRARQDAHFAEQEQEAMEEGIDRAEAEAFRRAVVGLDEPVINQGKLSYVYERAEVLNEETGVKEEQWRMALDEKGQPIPLTVRKFSDPLLALVLKGRRKKVYAERTELTGAGGAALPASQVTIVTGVPRNDHSDLA